MSLPKKLKIMGHIVSIKIDHEYCLNKGCNGESSPDEAIIRLVNFEKKGIPEDRQMQIVLHEILHMCNAYLGLQDTSMDEEQYIEQLSSLLNQIIPQLQ